MKRTIRALDLAGKRVLIRVDFNVPLEDGEITNDLRIRASLPTIRWALDQRAKVVILASHLGRPKGRVTEALSLAPVAVRLEQLIGRKVVFAADSVGEPAARAIEQAGDGGIVLLENLRFHPEEEANDETFARQLAAQADVYVNDAFGTAHRAHASTAGIVPFVRDAAVGLLMANELSYLGNAIENPARPFVAILGGAKVSSKLEVIENLLKKVDTLLLGGAMAYTFFKARGYPVGKSLVEDELVEEARGIEARAASAGVRLLLPVDHVVATKVEEGAATEVLAVDDPAIGDRIGVDVGPQTIRLFTDALHDAGTVVWNGPVGVFEIEAFARGTTTLASALAGSRGTTIVGGGDSIAAIDQAGVSDRIDHLSTGGGASLEFLGGRTLPGVAALPDA